MDLKVMGCIDCIEPPPDMILSMPPPPLPSFLLPKSTALSGHNESGGSQPCFAAFMCEPTGPREQSGIEFIELSHKDDTWLFILVSSCVGVILLGTLLAALLMKCKKTYNYYADTNTIKHPPIPPEPANGTLGPKTGTVRSTMLYPFVPSAHYQSALGADNRMLWATLTPHGTTQHFISEPYVVPQDDHYEVVDYHSRQKTLEMARKSAAKKSFENSGFVDFDYEDPTPLMESYNTDDLDSGYQEPQTINGSLYNEGSLRAFVSTPTRIENPNMAPLNMHRNLEVMNGTLNKKQGTIGRRISDLSTGSRSLKV